VEKIREKHSTADLEIQGKPPRPLRENGETPLQEEEGSTGRPGKKLLFREKDLKKGILQGEKAGGSLAALQKKEAMRRKTPSEKPLLPEGVPIVLKAIERVYTGGAQFPLSALKRAVRGEWGVKKTA